MIQTGYESWCYKYDPETKQQFKQLVVARLTLSETNSWGEINYRQCRNNFRCQKMIFGSTLVSTLKFEWSSTKLLMDDLTWATTSEWFKKANQKYSRLDSGKHWSWQYSEYTIFAITLKNRATYAILKKYSNIYSSSLPQRPTRPADSDANSGPGSQLMMNRKYHIVTMKVLTNRGSLVYHFNALAYITILMKLQLKRRHFDSNRFKWNHHVPINFFKLIFESYISVSSLSSNQRENCFSLKSFFPYLSYLNTLVFCSIVYNRLTIAKLFV